MSSDADSRPPNDGTFTRRSALQWAMGSATILGTGNLLAACGGGGAGTGKAASAPITVSRGGRLRVGMLSLGKGETLNPNTSIGQTNSVRSAQIFENLTAPTSKLPIGTKPVLAESWEANADATVWTFKLRSGVTFHDGKRLTADDVVYSIKYWVNPKGGNFNAATLAFVDAKNVRKRDDVTIEVPLTKAIAQFPEMLGLWTLPIFQDGTTNFKKPIGTGPFKFQSFTAGKNSLFVANKDYWQEGKPYLDELFVDSSFSTDSARLDALASGAIDIMPVIPYGLAKHPRAGVRVENAQSTNPYYFQCRVDQAPFSNPRVMEALRLAIDREAMAQTVFNGYARPTNDVPLPGLKFWSDFPIPARDVEKAKSLLKAAGHEGMTIKCFTSTAYDGYVQGTTLFKEQLKDVGVTLDIKQLDPTVYYTSSGGGDLLNYPMFADNPGNTIYYPCQTAFYLLNQWTKGGYNTTHYGSAQKDALLFDALAELDEAAADEKWRAVQQPLADNHGGSIAFGLVDYVDAYSPKVGGAKTTPAGWCDNFNFVETFLST
jgi:peptide/nickel transport system substrate-binding protein